VNYLDNKVFDPDQQFIRHEHWGRTFFRNILTNLFS